MSDSMDSLPPIEEPESEHNSIESLPPIDEPEEEVEEDLPPLMDEDPAEEEDPEAVADDEAKEEIANAVPIPVNKDQITGNELKHHDEKKVRVGVKLEEDYKAPQMAKQIKDKNKDAAYENADRGGDVTYEREGHGKILVVEDAKDTDSRMLHNTYYGQGYTAPQGNNMGKEQVKNYNYKRNIRKRQTEHVIPDKGVKPARPKRRLPAKKKKEKKKKKKRKNEFGTEEHPLRMARKDEREPIKLTCINCKSQITTNVKKELNMAKLVIFMIFLCPLVIFMNYMPFLHNFIHQCPNCTAVLSE